MRDYEEREEYVWQDNERVPVRVSEGEWQGSRYTQTTYEDGSSDTDFGGPCGPIYTDEFGNM